MFYDFEADCRHHSPPHKPIRQASVVGRYDGILMRKLTCLAVSLGHRVGGACQLEAYVNADAVNHAAATAEIRNECLAN